MMGSQQNFGDFANSLSFYGGPQEQEKKGYAMVSLQGAPSRSGSSTGKPSVPGFLGNILGSASTSAELSAEAAAGPGDWGAPGRLPSGMMKGPPSRSKEQNGLLQSGLSAVRDGASRMLDGANSVVNATRATIADNPLTSQNLLMFGVVAAVGVLFMFLAFLTLPLLVFAPSKFALLFTMGSLCFLAALALLRGVAALSRHLTEASRLPFTAVYFSSLFLTLYATLVAKSWNAYAEVHGSGGVASGAEAPQIRRIFQGFAAPDVISGVRAASGSHYKGLLSQTAALIFLGRNARSKSKQECRMSRQRDDWLKLLCSERECSLEAAAAAAAAAEVAAVIVVVVVLVVVTAAAASVVMVAAAEVTAVRVVVLVAVVMVVEAAAVVMVAAAAVAATRATAPAIAAAAEAGGGRRRKVK
ncbi:hypothetical protein Efla_004301 [Eimeria flavescens]